MKQQVISFQLQAVNEESMLPWLQGQNKNLSASANDKMDDNDDTISKLKKLTVVNRKRSASDCHKFDKVIGHIEDLLIDETFFNLQKNFLETFWTDFEDSEENKHSYMEIFFNYTNAIESHISKYLEEKIPEFSMKSFINELVERKNELEGEVFEVLFTLTDFTAFKEMFLDYRKMKLGGGLNLSSAISIVPISH